MTADSSTEVLVGMLDMMKIDVLLRPVEMLILMEERLMGRTLVECFIEAQTTNVSIHPARAYVTANSDRQRVHHSANNSNLMHVNWFWAFTEDDTRRLLQNMGLVRRTIDRCTEKQDQSSLLLTLKFLPRLNTQPIR